MFAAGRVPIQEPYCPAFEQGGSFAHLIHDRSTRANDWRAKRGVIGALHLFAEGQPKVFAAAFWF